MSTQPVMRRSLYCEHLGILVNAVLLRVLVEIENQEDISEEASHRLNDLCKMLHEVEGLFVDEEKNTEGEGSESTVALHVKVWFKFKFLSELLEASMVRLPEISLLLNGENGLTDLGYFCTSLQYRPTSCSCSTKVTW